MSALGAARVRIRRVEGPPLVVVRLLLPGGARGEDLPGQALLAGRTLTEGSRRRSWRRIAEEAEALGMSLEGAAGWDATQLTLEALSTDWQVALQWAVELATEPLFSGDRVRWVAQQTEGELLSLSELGDVRTGWVFAGQLYGEHPRGRPLQGSAESLRRLGRADCSAFHDRALGAGAILAVAGRIDEAAVGERLESLLASPEPGDARWTGDAVGEVIAHRPGRREVILPRGEQAHVFMGRLTVRRTDPRLPALMLLSAILGAGAGLAGRLPHRLREREGLAYSVGVAAAGGAGFDPGRFEIYVGTSPQSAEQAVACAREELARLLADGVEEAEVETALAYLLGRLPFARETAAQWAALLAEAELYGLPLDRPGWIEERLQSVSVAEIEGVAREFLDPSSLSEVVGRPAS